MTFDHEHVPTELLEKLVAEGVNVAPPPEALIHAQDKLVMRRRLEAIGAPIPRYAEVTDVADLDAFAPASANRSCVKTARGGYDGRGVLLARDLDEARDFAGRNLAEGIPVSGRGARRDATGAGRPGGPVAVRAGRGVAGGGDRAARRHLRRGDRARARSGPPRPASAAGQLALRLADELGVVGVLAVELFETVDGALLVNELAMRPHNSGHWTMDGASTSQFEQHLRAVLDYPLGDTGPVAPVTVMANVLGAPEKPAHGDGRTAAPPVRPDSRRQGAPVRQGRSARAARSATSTSSAKTVATKTASNGPTRAAHWLSHAQWTDGWDGHD